MFTEIILQKKRKSVNEFTKIKRVSSIYKHGNEYFNRYKRKDYLAQKFFYIEENTIYAIEKDNHTTFK